MQRFIKSVSTLTLLILLSAFSFSQDVVLSYGAVDTDAGTMEVYMVNTVDVYGFQFTVDNIDGLSGASGGSAAANGFFTSTSSAGLVLGFSLSGGSIPAGEGVLTTLAFSGLTDPAGQICYSSPIFSGAAGASLEVDASACWPEIPGCMDPLALNYNPDATVDDGSCVYPPDPPTNLAASGGDGEIVLTWDAVTRDGSRADIQLSISNITDTSVEIYMVNTADVYGFQFNLVPDDILAAAFGAASGGSAAGAQFAVQVSGTLVLGFSFMGTFIPAGEGVLTNISWTPGGIDGFMTLANGIFSGAAGASLSVEYGAPTCYGSCPIVAYNVYREGNLLAEGLSENTYTDGGLGLAESHCYNVTFFNGANESNFSNEACAATFDCNGLAGGEAFIDACGNCVGGDTGLEENYAMDCAGVCDGESVVDDCGDCVLPEDFNSAMDDCGVCNGGNTDMDCNGDCFGTAVVDGCGICSGGNSGHDADSDMDCNGDCFGSFITDDCGDCVDLVDFNAAMDCNGFCDGTAFENECGCVGGDTGLAEDFCYGCTDFDAENFCDVCTIDDGSCVYPPDPPTNLAASGGDGEIVLTWDALTRDGSRADIQLSISNITDTSVEIYMVNTADVYGFQFNLVPDDILAAAFGAASGGSAAGAGFAVQVSGTMVLGFSFTGSFIPAGEGVLTNISWTPGGIDGFMTLANGIFSGAAGASLSVEYGAPTCYGSCPEPIVYSYNVYRDGILLAEGLDVTTYTDSGLGLAESHCYTATSHDGTYESDPSNEACASTFDCNGVAGGTAFIDNCGNCVGGDTGLEENYAMDCAGVCDGESVVDDCGDCVLPADLNGAMDDCGVCNGGNADMDCNGDCFGEAFTDDCGYCVGGNTGLEANYAMDCAGVCDGESVVDDCGDCVLPADLNGAMDDCGICNGGNVDMDCNGDCFGEAFTDDCGYCVGGNTGLEANYAMDCAGVCDGESVTDDCGDCVLPADFNGAMDCAGVCEGSSYTDNCGVCDDDPNNDDLSCSGCMDSTAINYDPLATLADGSCIFEVTVDPALGVTFETEDGSIIIVIPGGNSFYIDGEVSEETLITIQQYLGDGLRLTVDEMLNNIPDDYEYGDNGIFAFTPFDLVMTEPAALTIPYWSYAGDEASMEVLSLDGIDDATWAISPGAVCADGTCEFSTTTLGLFIVVRHVPGIVDCAGVEGGSAYIDNCGDCVGGTTGLDPCQIDCMGAWGGDAVADDCGDCVLPADFNAAMDCNGDCAGTAFIDDCGYCAGGNTGMTENYAMDCNGVCDGTAIENECGCVGGDTGLAEDFCYGCTDDTATNYDPDAILACNGDNSCCEYTQEILLYIGAVDEEAGTLEVWMNNNGPESVAGFQFNVSGLNVTGASGGTADSHGFMVSTNPDGTILGFILGTTYIDSGDEMLTLVSFDALTDNQSCLSGAVISGPPGVGALPVVYGDCVGYEIFGCTDPAAANYNPIANNDDGSCQYAGCMDVGACNFDENADVDDGSCLYLDCNDECGGTAFIDDCGYCAGGSTGMDENYAMDCNDDCDGTAALDDCGECSGGGTGLDPNWAMDDCGVCNGGNADMDCYGDCFGDAFTDDCGNCVGGNTDLEANYAMDCAGVCDGLSVVDDCGDCVLPDDFNGAMDDCGVCNGGNADMDCYGDCFGTAFTDDCGNCVGGNTGLEENWAVDCNGDCFGDAFIDSCSYCVGGNTGMDENYAMDCNGDCDGTAFIDSCLECVSGDTGLEENYAFDDCGICFGGNADMDDCGVCNGGNADMDCNGDCFGTAFTDDCGNCVGGNTGLEENWAVDCNGDCFGDAFIDSCGDCVGGNTGMDENYAMDCSGDCDGTAFIDSCLECVSGNTGLEENYAFDDCGICFGGNVDMDCNGDCFGTAFTDQCDECVGGETGMEEDWAVDDCGVCFGENADMDCNGDCFGEAFENECGCVGGDTGLADDVCYGCMDPGAVNYDPDVIFEDGSCIYTMTLESTLLPNQLNNISLFVDPTDPNIENMFAGFDLLLLKDDAGHYYVPEVGVNLVGDWILEKGYKTYINGDSELTLATEGTLAVPEGHPIALSPFMMNNVAYLRNDALNIADVLADVPVLLARDDGGHFYAPGVPVNTIDETGGMQPGSAYEIFLSGMEGSGFTYPAYGTLARTPLINEEYFSTISQHYEIAKSGISTPVIITELAGEVSVGDELAAYAHGELVGATRITNLDATVVIAAWESFSDYNLDLPGYHNGDAIEIRLWSQEQNRELPVIANLDNDFYGQAPLTTGSITVTDAAEMINGFMLANNYPNPFNPETSIEFVIPLAANVSLEIYDITGRHIRTLVSGELSAGMHRVVWDGLDVNQEAVSAGMYLYTLNSDQVTITKKMVMMK